MLWLGAMPTRLSPLCGNGAGWCGVVALKVSKHLHEMIEMVEEYQAAPTVCEDVKIGEVIMTVRKDANECSMEGQNY